MTTILITGANRGIGLEFVRQYAADGARVFACCREPGQAAELNKIAAASKGAVSVYLLDVTRDESVSLIAEALEDETIDILINNAGIGAGRNLRGHVDYDVWAEILRVNTMGPFRVTQAFRANLMKGKTRKVITISSSLGSITLNQQGNHTYRSSKAAVNRVMHALSVEWQGDGFLAVLLHPGWVKTDMGGPNATLAVEESVKGMCKIIMGLKAGDNGRFLDYTGKEIPW